jgi:hypothetical protein
VLHAQLVELLRRELHVEDLLCGIGRRAAGRAHGERTVGKGEAERGAPSIGTLCCPPMVGWGAVLGGGRGPIGRAQYCPPPYGPVVRRAAPRSLLLPVVLQCCSAAVRAAAACSSRFDGGAAFICIFMLACACNDEAAADPTTSRLSRSAAAGSAPLGHPDVIPGSAPHATLAQPAAGTDA